MSLRGSMLALLLLASLMQGGVVRGDELEDVFGQRWTGTLENISADGSIRISSATEPLPLKEMRFWSQEGTSSTPPTEVPDVNVVAPGRITVTGHHGLRGHPQSLTFNGDTFSLTFAPEIVAQIPFDAVEWVCLRPDGIRLPAPLREAIARPTRDGDRVVLQVEKQLELVSGLIASLDATNLVMEVGGMKRTIPLDRVHGFVLAASKPRPDGGILLQMADGSRLPAKAARFDSQQWQVTWSSGGSLSLPRNQLAKIDFRPLKMTYLSDLEPVAATEETIFTPPATWQRDRSVGGRPLRVGGRVYEHGLGVHARSELSFSVSPEHRWFLATLGIDDEVLRDSVARSTPGQCTFVVLADGRELVRRTLRGGETPEPVRVELRNVRKLTLLVEPDEDFDFADHADWCDARLVKDLP